MKFMERIDIKKGIHKYPDQPRCFYLGERNQNRFIYKYMDLEAAIISLATDSIRFVEPHQWEDQYESRFYNASYTQVNNAAGNTPPVLACCFSYASVNETAWKLYSHTKTGLGARCVKIKINKKAFRKQLVSHNSDYQLYEGEVDYSLDDYQINHLHKRQYPNGTANSRHDELFADFDLASYLSLMLIKRQAFLHEQELRYFMIPNFPDLKGSIEHEEFNIEWKRILTDIVVDEHCTDTELSMLIKVLESKGIDIVPKREFIYAMPGAPIVIES